MHPTESKVEPGRPRRLVYLGRMAVIAGLVLVCWFTLQSYFRLLEGPRPPRTPTEEEDPAAPLEVLARVPEGPWQLGDQPWTVKMSQASPEEVVAIVTAPWRESALPAWSVQEGMLVQLIQNAGGKRWSEGKITVCAMENPELRWRAYLRRDGKRDRLLGGRLAQLRDGLWHLMEVRPDAEGGRRLAGRLLPWPESSQRVAVRLDEQGSVFAELVLSPQTPTELAVTWREQGWKRAGDATLSVFRHDGEVIQVWAPGKAQDGKHILLAIRATPARTDQTRAP